MSFVTLLTRRRPLPRLPGPGAPVTRTPRLAVRVCSLLSATALVATLSACGASSTTATSGSSGSSKSNPLSGKTIDLVSSGAAGSSHDLEARAEASYMASYLHATVDVVDKPGGGQLLAWNYVNSAQPNGLTVGTVDVEGALANLWEEVPNNNVKPTQIIMLGGLAGGITGASEVMFAPKSLPWTNIYSLLKERSRPVKELGSVGDVPGPLLFGAYHVPHQDLTSYASSTDELQGLLRGDGDISIKSWAGSWASYATSGPGRVLLAYTMRPVWKERPSVPTIAQILKKAPITGPERTAVVTDTSALDAGTGLFAPPKTPPSIVGALRKAVAYAISQPGFKSRAAKAQISDTYESPTSQQAVLDRGASSGTVSLMRKFVPLHTGVAS